MVHCVAFGCTNKKKKGDGLHFFSFPRDEVVRRVWIVKLKREGYIWKSTHKLCSDHFTPDCYERDPNFMKELGYTNALPRLKADAVPTRFTFTSACASTVTSETPKIRGGYMKRRRIELINDCLNQNTDVTTEDTGISSMNEDPELNKDEPVLLTNPATEHTYSPIRINQKVQVKPDVKSKGTFCCQTSTNNYTQTEVNKVDASTQYSIEFCDASCQTEPDTLEDSEDLVHPSFESIDYLEDDNHNNDPDYIPDFVSCDLTEDSEEIIDINNNIHINDNVSPNNEKKYLVFQSSLLTLFNSCSMCLCAIVKKKITCIGTMIIVTVNCTGGHEWCWYSQPSHKGMPWGNLLAGAATLISGNGYNKIASFLDILNVPFISQSTFTKTQRSYFVPAVTKYWANSKQELLDSLRDKDVVVGGDGRCDSPGYNAKYGSYTLMDLQRNKILDIQIVQSNEVGGSVKMELEGLKRGLSILNESGINVARLVTDRHVQIKKYMRENQAGIKHDFDVWHVANNIDKKITATSKKKTGEEIKPWIASIKNHLYWVATSSGDDGSLKRAKWLSILNHISDQHTGHSDIFPACVHGELEPRKWIRKGSVPYKLLAPIIDNNYLLKDIEKLSPTHQTYGLEVFHSLLLMFAPKTTHYFYWSMLARSYLAALHYNENSDNKQAQTLDCTPRFAPVFPKKHKGEVMVVKPVKEKPTYDYAVQIMHRVVQRRLDFPSYRLANDDANDLLVGEPVNLTSNFVKIDKEELIVNRITRFPNV